MGVKLVSASGGSVEINPPATASSFTATMPAGTGNVVVNGINGALVAATAQNSTSGTSIDFTGIPSWVRRVTVMFNGVSTNGSSATQVQIGSGSVTTSGYVGRSGYLINAGASSVAAATTGFATDAAGAAAEARTGVMTITLQTGNTYVSSCQICSNSSALFGFGNGAVTLGGTLDRIRITTVNGTDTFDAGSINILYE